MANFRSITQIGTSEPFELQVARGQIPGHSALHKFGAVPEMSVNTTGTVWDIDDTLYPWSAFSSASILTVDRANASDAGKTIVIIGLDANYNEISEKIKLTEESRDWFFEILEDTSALPNRWKKAAKVARDIEE